MLQYHFRCFKTAPALCGTYAEQAEPYTISFTVLRAVMTTPHPSLFSTNSSLACSTLCTHLLESTLTLVNSTLTMISFKRITSSFGRVRLTQRHEQNSSRVFSTVDFEFFQNSSGCFNYTSGGSKLLQHCVASMPSRRNPTRSVLQFYAQI